MDDDDIKRILEEELNILHTRFKKLQEMGEEKNNKEIRLLSNEVNEKIRLLKTFESKETFDIAQFLPFIMPLLSTLSNKNRISLVESLIDLFLNKSFLKEFEITDIKDLIPKFEKLIKELSSEIEKRN